jgi:transcriptional regulator with XRE-family HTH domain
MIGRMGFGARLRAHRERQGITLRSIAESTKIKHSLLEALERGDVSQWPQGLFRRAYLREYAAAIGLPSEPLVAEFLQLFPEDGQGASPDAAVTPVPLRLTLDSAPATEQFAQRLPAALIELGVVAAAAAATAYASGMTFLAAAGSVALVYYPIAMLLADRTAVWRQVTSAVTHAFGASPTSTPPDLEPARLYVVVREAPAESFSAPVTGEDLAKTASR